jgi:hypothetical protein
MPQGGAGQPAVVPNEPETAGKDDADPGESTDEEELVARLARAQTARRKREIRAQIAEQEGQTGGTTVLEGPLEVRTAKSTYQLPKPKDPHTFEGKGRADFDEWERDLKRLFTLRPDAFQSDKEKVTYASFYLGKRQQDIWERRMEAEGPEGTTWNQFTTIMLDSMGSQAERAQRAHDILKDIKQGTQTPTQLLDNMKKHWEEINMAQESLQILSFVSALNQDIKWRLEVSQRKFDRLVDVEDAAMAAHRQTEHKRSREGNRGTKRQHVPTQSESERHYSAQKRPFGYRGARTISYGPRTDSRDGDECYGCKQKGHIRANCTNQHLWSPNDNWGKDKAPQKSS